MRNGNRQRYSLTGHISQIAIAGVNVPHPLRPVLETQRNAPRRESDPGSAAALVELVAQACRGGRRRAGVFFDRGLRRSARAVAIPAPGHASRVTRSPCGRRSAPTAWLVDLREKRKPWLMKR